MIQAKNLRVGNYVTFHDDNTIYSVVSIEEKGIGVKNQEEETWIELDRFSPIPLTEDILLKCGFEKAEDLGDQIYYQLPNEKHGFSICADHDDWGIYHFNSSGQHCIMWGEEHMLYLHQLQNLFFALRGQELEVNL